MTHAQRIREIRARGRIRRWEYRQRNLAHDAWLRFRTALAQAELAFRISPELYAALAADGAKIDDRCAGLEPPRHIVWISRAQAAGLQGHWSWYSGSMPKCLPPSTWLSSHSTVSDCESCP
jgi:hypothetical protein